MAIKQLYDVNRAPARRDVSLVMREGGLVSTTLFTRAMPCGMVLVLSYLTVNRAFVEAVIDGVHWEIWYDHAPYSQRQVALLVNRFLADVEKEKA